MIILGSIVVLVIFLGVGWAVATEMFQHRAWRNRVRAGDAPIVRALIEEALAAWRHGRPPRGTPASIWAGVQAVELVAVTQDSATFSGSASGAFRTEDGHRVQAASALDEAIALAVKVLDMTLYDVPNLSLAAVRVDIYTTFPGVDGTPEQRPILTSTATRLVADSLTWELLEPAEILARFETAYEPGPSGQGVPIELPPIEGSLPEQPSSLAAEAAKIAS